MSKVCYCSECGAQCSNKYHTQRYNWKDPDANVLCKKCWEQYCKESSKAWGFGIPFVIGCIVALGVLLGVRDAYGAKVLSYASYAGVGIGVLLAFIFDVMMRRASNRFTRWLWRFIRRLFFGAIAVHIFFSIAAYKVSQKNADSRADVEEQVQDATAKPVVVE